MKKIFLLTILFLTIISCATKYEEYTNENLPNDSFKNAYNLKTDGKFVKGSFDASGDVEYYKFYARRYIANNQGYIYYHLKIRRPGDKAFKIVVNYYKSNYDSHDYARSEDASSDLEDVINFYNEGLYYLSIKDYNDEYAEEYEISIGEYDHY